jgi:predicted  nucleic acid-binding Zn-ribbon protein
MDNLVSEVTAFRKRLKNLRDHYDGLGDAEQYIAVEDSARRAYQKLGDIEDSLDVLAVELKQVSKHLASLVNAERKLNTKRKKEGDAEVKVCHAMHNDFSASNLAKLNGKT